MCVLGFVLSMLVDFNKELPNILLMLVKPWQSQSNLNPVLDCKKKSHFWAILVHFFFLGHFTSQSLKYLSLYDYETDIIDFEIEFKIWRATGL